MEASRALQGEGGPPLDDIPRLTAYHDVDHVLRSKDFVQAGGGHRENAPMTLHTVVSLSGQDHFERRRIEAPVFSRASLEACERDVLEPAIVAALARCRAKGDGGEVVRVDLLTLARDVLARVSACIVGIDISPEDDDIQRLLVYTDRLSDGHNVDWSSRNHDEVMRVALDVKRRFVEEYFAPSWQRRAEINSGASPRDDVSIDLLSSMIGEADHFAQWDLDTVVRETVLFLTAAIGSPARAIPFVVSELDGWLNKHGEDRDQLGDPEFIRTSINEALRLHTPGSPKLRRASRDVSLPSGRRMREGDHVAADIAAANRDVDVFGADADAFNPRREPRSVQAFGVAFGAGPHTCIGLFMTMGKPGAEPTGTLVRLLLELYRAGMRPDPDRPPTQQPDNPKRFATFPILLAAP